MHYQAHRACLRRSDTWPTRAAALVLMHREIIGVPYGVQVDHIDHDGLNNTRGNLRLATHSQNNANRPRIWSSSGCRGVTIITKKRMGKLFIAKITRQNRHQHLGRFECPIEAAKAYDAAAIKAFGEFAILNFPD